MLEDVYVLNESARRGEAFSGVIRTYYLPESFDWLMTQMREPHLRLSVVNNCEVTLKEFEVLRAGGVVAADVLRLNPFRLTEQVGSVAAWWNAFSGMAQQADFPS